MKRDETKKIENILLRCCFGSNPKIAKEYGTTEVTIGFQRDGMGKEIVDFISYNPTKNIFRCYEIKISMSDYRSKAKKSWYGDYNYLVLSSELYEKQSLNKWKEELPPYVGILVIDPDINEKQCVKKPQKIEINDAMKNILKDSLIRTLFYQKKETIGGINDVKKIR